MAADSNDSDPGDEEINEYAELIGIDPSKEAQLMWIARQGITAPLPVDWKPVQTDDGELYFHNNKTNQSLWEHPSDQKFRQMVVEERAKLQAKNLITTLPPSSLSSKPPLGKLAPLAPLAPIAKKSVLAPISTQPRPLTSVDQKPAPNAADAAALPNKSLERPKTSRGHMTTTADEESPRKVLGGGSRFLKKTDSVDLKDDIKPTPNAENKAQVLSLDLNATTAAEKKTLLYASLGLSDNSESNSDADDVPTSSIVEKIQEKTNDATITKQNPLTVVAPTITAVKPPLLISEQKPAIATSSVKIESVAAAVKPAVNALAKQDNVKIVEMEKREQEILNASLQERLSQFKSELEKREKQEKEKMRKEHEILLEKMRDEHKSEKLRIEKDFEEKLIEFKNERQKAEQKKKDEYLLDNGKLINETMLKLQKENNAKLADLKQKLDQDFELEHRKLVVDQEERMSQLKQDLNRQFEEYKLKLEHETDAMEAEESRKVGSRIRQESSSSKAEKSCQVTIENNNTPKMNPDPENHFLDQSLADLHLELEGMRRDLRDLTGVVRELKKVDMPAPMVKKDVRHVEKHANKPKNKKKQKFIKSLDEFLTSCDEDQIKHDPILEKLETEDTIKKARQFINNQNFQTNRPRMDNFPQYSWKFEKKDNFDEMINARLRQVFPESNTFSSLFVPMHDRRENSPIRKSNVEMELESLKNWLKKFEKEIK